MRTCPAPWGMSAQEHTFTFCQICFISGGNYTLITCIQYTTMVTHSECEISQSWRTQFSSHGALLTLTVRLCPPLPLHKIQFECKIHMKQDCCAYLRMHSSACMKTCEARSCSRCNSCTCSSVTLIAVRSLALLQLVKRAPLRRRHT